MGHMTTWKNLFGLLTGKAPNYDHTLWSPEGHYLYLDVPDMQVQVAQLISLTLLAGPDCTFTLHYNMYGANFGTLSVLFR